MLEICSVQVKTKEIEECHVEINANERSLSHKTNNAWCKVISLIRRLQFIDLFTSFFLGRRLPRVHNLSRSRLLAELRPTFHVSHALTFSRSSARLLPTAIIRTSLPQSCATTDYTDKNY